MPMSSLSLIIAAAIAQAAAPSADVAKRERMVADTVTWLRANLSHPSSTQFRRVYFRTTKGQDGQQHLSICGQALQDDARAPIGWRAFAAADVRGEVMVMLGRGRFGDIADFCRPDDGVWDYSEDLAPRIARDLLTAK